MSNRKKMVHRMKVFKENIRWRFWGYIMDNYPRFYKWADRYLPFDMLPF